MYRVCIDPGHGGAHPGAVGASGLRECDVVLDVCLMLRDLLSGWQEPPLHALVARHGDYTLGLRQRAIIASEYGADLLVSVHTNSAQARDADGSLLFHDDGSPVLDPGPNGYEAWTTRGQTASDAAADYIFRALERRFPDMRGRSDVYSDGDLDREADYRVLLEAERLSVPAVLVELAFISHPPDEALLSSGSWRREAAHAIAAGVVAWLRTLPT